MTDTFGRKPPLDTQSLQPTIHGIGRRQLLQSAGAAAVLAGTAGGLWPNAARAQGVSHYNMDIVLAPVDDPNLLLRTYNGKSPGPTLATDAGGKITVSLNNGLDTQPDAEVCPAVPNQFHGANVTNLHTHGLHVSPNVSPSSGLDSDNIFLKVTPVDQNVPCMNDDFRIGSNEYMFDIPDTHPPGTFWYHAHQHGSTARQVANGLAGPLIIKDPPGFMPPYIAGAKEDVFMIQLRDLKADTDDPRASRGDGVLTIVRTDPDGGGEKNPTIVMAPGEVRRWRFINAATSADAFVTLNLSGGADAPELWQIAYDGLTLPKRIKVDPDNTGDPWENPAALAPGNRTDFMIRVPGGIPPGQYMLAADLTNPELVQGGGAPQAMVLAAAEPVGLTIEIKGDPVIDVWSDDDTLPGPGQPPIDISEVSDTWKAEFFLNTKTGDHMINGLEFDGQVHKTMVLNTVEEWTIVNNNTFVHPFHIHVNPFLVTHINGVELALDDPLRRWQDTIALPVATQDADGNVTKQGSITFLSRYTVFTGKFVIHCHILGHEDRGMMQAVEVIPEA